MATLRGALALDLTSSELAAGRLALARAIQSGALGPGYAVSLDGEAVVFDGPRTSGADRGRVELHADGRATFEVTLEWAERARVAQAAGLAALVSVTAALLFGWMFFLALPAGAVAGVVWAVLGMVGDRRRVERDLRALLRGLPLLVDARGEQPRQPLGLDADAQRLRR
jgi:hypothetical protein